MLFLAENFLGELLENRQSTLDGLGLDAIRNAHMTRCAKVGTRYDRQIILLRHLAELIIIDTQGLREDIERTARLDALIAVRRQRLIEQITVLFVDRQF